jgi:succinate dehydrogenase/fumarate reductase flavoprotein subunit
VDESTTNSFETGYTRAVQPGGAAWSIFDDELAAGATFAEAAAPESTWTLEALEESGAALRADDLATLAQDMGVDVLGLQEEIVAFNAFARGEAEDAFRTTALAPAIDRAPFHALPVAASAAKGFGGVDVDLAGRVLDTAGAPMPGLYAAGELTGMLGGTLVGDWGFTGSLTAVVLGGRVAGQNAAAEALAR